MKLTKLVDKSEITGLSKQSASDCLVTRISTTFDMGNPLYLMNAIKILLEHAPEEVLRKVAASQNLKLEND